VRAVRAQKLLLLPREDSTDFLVQSGNNAEELVVELRTCKARAKAKRVGREGKGVE
jgi:hypothetical protein